MALCAADTPEGRAVLINAAMESADLGYLVSNKRLIDLILERWPHCVHYYGKGKPRYCPPDQFGFWQKRGVTDCDWIVPGTL